MNLDEYIKEYYNGNEFWFVSEVISQRNMDKTNEILRIKEYLNGKHSILANDTEQNGIKIKPSKIVLNFANTLIDFSTSFLLKNPVTLTCEDADTLNEFKQVYKKNRWHNKDFKILRDMLAYGMVGEYVYGEEDGTIASQILNPLYSFPVYSDTGEYICFIYHYTMALSNISYYTVYYQDVVIEYNNINGKVKEISRKINYSGLPVIYKTMDYENETKGRSDLENWVDIIDNIEKLLSKYHDALYKYITGVPVMTGTKLNVGKNGEGAVNPSVVGNVLQLEDGSTFDFKQNQTDYQSMKLLYDIEFNNLLIASQTPAVSMNKQDVSNLAESSIRMMYQLPILKGSINSQYMLDGFIERWEQIRKLLSVKGIEVSGDLECVFSMSIPQNEKEIIENLKSLREIKGISLDTMLSINPYTIDVQGEKERILAEEGNGDVDESSNNVYDGLVEKQGLQGVE